MAWIQFGVAIVVIAVGGVVLGLLVARLLARWEDRRAASAAEPLDEPDDAAAGADGMARAPALAKPESDRPAEPGAGPSLEDGASD